MKFHSNGTSFDALQICFTPFHYLNTIEGCSDTVALGKDFHLDPFVLGTDIFCRRFEDPEPHIPDLGKTTSGPCVYHLLSPLVAISPQKAMPAWLSDSTIFDRNVRRKSE